MYVCVCVVRQMLQRESVVVGSVQTGDGSRDKSFPESQSANKHEEAGVGWEREDVYGY